jgi:hypothetical protein
MQGTSVLFPSRNPRHLVEVGVEADDLSQLQPLHQDDVVAFGKAQGALAIEGEDLPIGAFAGEDDPGPSQNGLSRSRCIVIH